LSVNINRETREALREITERRSIPFTEAIRRAAAVYKLVEDEISKGHRIQIDDGVSVREIILLG